MASFETLVVCDVTARPRFVTTRLLPATDVPRGGAISGSRCPLIQRGPFGGTAGQIHGGRAAGGQARFAIAAAETNEPTDGDRYRAWAPRIESRPDATLPVNAALQECRLDITN